MRAATDNKRKRFKSQTHAPIHRLILIKHLVPMNTKRHQRRSRRTTAMRPARRTRCFDRWGASLVEFAIVSNLLLITILTCMEFARMNMVRNLAQDAAYYAARHAIVPGATPSEAIAEGNRIMGALLNNGYSVNVAALDGDSRFVDVTVSVDMGAVALFAPLFLPEQTVDTRVRMRTERYSGFFQQ